MPTSRAPLWNKSMARFVGNSDGKTPEPEKPEPTPEPVLTFDQTMLATLGLGHLAALTSDPRLLAEGLKADDAADAQADLDEFTRGIRRAVRLRLAFEARLHRRAGQPWVKWVADNFDAGYRCFHRYHVAAEIQLGLISRGLPLLSNEYQSRVIAPLRRHDRFWEGMEAFKGALPPGPELRRQLAQELGLVKSPEALSARIRLHRILSRAVFSTPGSDDVMVGQALGIVRQAIALLEKGGAA